MNKLNEITNWIKENWDKIPDKYKINIKPERYSDNVKDLKLEGHIVILLVDRQKPSVEACYDFDEERFGVNKFGEIIWGFDSGCSCPTPWYDSYPNCYKTIKTWKEFKSDGFDADYLDEAIKKFRELKQSVEKSSDRKNDKEKVRL